MLTADLVHTRRRGDRLTIVPLDPALRARAHELAAAAIAVVRAHVGLARGALLEAWSQIPVAPVETRVARGLWKLALDACQFDEGGELDPIALRREVFLRAAAQRKAEAVADGGIDRHRLLAEIAVDREVGVAAIEQALYADLPAAHILREARLPSPEGLVASYELAQRQAVLLRAVRVRARVFCAQPAAYRDLFRKLKFHRLLHTIARLERGGYAIDIDGPMSLFEQTTKYGLRLALALPAIMACSRWDLTAEVRWGKERRPLRYNLAGGEEAGPEPTADGADDAVGALLADLRGLASPWQAAPAQEVLDVPGVGVCVPDLQLVRRETGQRVFLELLGFWSRAAVWKRVEMVEGGLGQPIVFAVSKHLRVSEEALPDDVPASLYVYARTPSASAVLDHVERVAARRRA